MKQVTPESSKFDFNCPSCGRLIKGIHTSYVGSKAHCKKCKQPITVPSPPETTESNEQHRSVEESEAADIEHLPTEEKSHLPNQLNRVVYLGVTIAFCFMVIGIIYSIQSQISLSAENKQLRADMKNAKIAAENSKSTRVMEQLKYKSPNPEGLEEVRDWLRENLHAPEWYEISYCPPNSAKQYFKDLLDSYDKAKVGPERKDLERLLVPDGARPLFEKGYFRVSKVTIRSQIPAGGFVKNDLYFYNATETNGSLSVIQAYPLNDLKNSDDTFEKAVYSWLLDSITKDLSGTEIDLGSTIHR